MVSAVTQSILEVSTPSERSRSRANTANSFSPLSSIEPFPQPRPRIEDAFVETLSDPIEQFDSAEMENKATAPAASSVQGNVPPPKRVCLSDSSACRCGVLKLGILDNLVVQKVTFC